MKKNYFNFCLALLLLCLRSTYTAQNFDWARQFGASGDPTRGIMIKADPQGNVYSVGTFSGTADFDPSSGTYTLSSPGANDAIYISKVDSAGNFLWARELDMANSSLFDASDLAIDRLGNAYLLCDFGGTLDADPGPGNYTISSTAPSGSPFILKLNPAGNFIWAKVFQGGSECLGQSISLDPLQNIYVGGTLGGSNIDFDPDTSSYLLSEVFSSQNYPLTTFFLSKLDSNGKFVFAKVFNNFAISHGQSVITAGNEIISVCVSIALSGMPTGLSIIKFDMSGNVLWSETINAYIIAYSVALDKANNICIVGDFQGTVDFDPSPSTYTLSAPGVTNTAQSSNLFILQLNSVGNFNWAKQLMLNVPFGQRIDGNSQNICTDTIGNIYIGAVFKNSVDFDPGLQTYTLNSIQGNGFILKLSSNGGFDWVKELGENWVNSLAADALGNLYATGNFGATVDCDPGTGIYNLTALGTSDGFVTKFSTYQKPNSIQSQALQNDLSIFPNPTTSIVYLQVGHHLNQATIKLLDINGRVLLEKQTLNGNSFALDVSSQPKGLYILCVSDDISVARIKLLKE